MTDLFDFDRRHPELVERAWRVRENAKLVGPTGVGAAVLATNGGIYVGCNVEHKYRAHCVHAEVNALTNMIATNGNARALAVIIAAKRDSFTPCGGCLDWIFELGGEQTVVGFSAQPFTLTSVHTAAELMPHYPC